MVRWTSFVSYRSNKLFNAGFQWLGETMYKRPCVFILAGLLLTILAGTGILFMEQESAIINLWVPQSSSIYKDFTLQQDYFGSAASSMVLLFRGYSGGNVMTPTALTQAYEAMNRIDDISATYNDETYTFSDVCAKIDVTSTECVAKHVNLHSIFFENEETIWSDEQYISGALNTDGINFFAGSIQYDDAGETAVAANVLRVYYELVSTTDADFEAAMGEYQRAFNEYWTEHAYDFSEFEVIWTTSNSIDDELLRTIVQDSIMFAIAFGVMLVYLQFTLGNISCLRGRALLATSSVFILICALIFGFGVSAYLGMKFSTLVFVVPFLLLGVGVDDMIIILDTLNHTKLPGNNEEFRAKQLGLALQHSGVAVSLTSFCSIIAFFAGTITDLPGLQYFCFYAAFSFLGNYILQFLLYVPLLVLDNKRIQQSRNCCCPCFVHGGPAELLAGDEPSSVSDHAAHGDDESGEAAKCCSLNWILDHSLIKLLSSTIGRLCIIAVFVALLAVSGYFATKVKALSDPTMLVPDDSYVIPYFDVTATAWAGDKPETIQIIFVDTDWSDVAVRTQVYALMDKVENLTVVQGEVDNWLEPFTAYLADKDVNIDEIADQAEFYTYLKQFEQDSDYDHWDDELVFDDDSNPSKIVATKFYFSAMEPSDVLQQYENYLFYKDLVKESMGEDTSSFMMQSSWPYSYFDYALRGYTLQNLVVSSVAVLLILLLLMDMRLALFIMLIILGIDVCLFGWMYMVGIDLQTISFCQLCMAVGLTVDYVIHMVHAIGEIRLDANQNTYERRIKFAMRETGSSVIKGALTTFIGASVLAFAQSVAFRSFFYMLAGIIIVATLFGLCLAPALMGQFAFIYSGLDEVHAQLAQDNDVLEYQGVAMMSQTEDDSYDDHDAI